MKNIIIIFLLSVVCCACNDDMEAPISTMPTNANITLYSYDCPGNPIDCLDGETNRVGGVFHQLFDNETSYIQGVAPIHTASSSSQGVALWTQLDVKSYYLVSNYQARVYEKQIIAKLNTNSYFTVIFE